MNEKTRSIISHIIAFIGFCFCFSAIAGIYFRGRSGVSSDSLNKLDNLIDSRAERDYERLRGIIESIRE